MAIQVHSYWVPLALLLVVPAGAGAQILPPISERELRATTGLTFDLGAQRTWAAETKRKSLEKIVIDEKLADAFPVTVIADKENDLSALRGYGHPGESLLKTTAGKYDIFLPAKSNVGKPDIFSGTDLFKNRHDERWSADIGGLFQVKRRPVISNGVKLQQLSEAGADNLAKIMRDPTIDKVRVVNFDLRKLNNSRFSNNKTRLCEANEDLCGGATSTGWRRDGVAPKMSVKIDDGNRQGDILFVQKGATVFGVVNTSEGTEILRHLGDGTFALTTSTLASKDRNSNDVLSLRADKPQALSPVLTTNPAAGKNFEADDDCPNPSTTAVLDLILAYTPKAVEKSLDFGYDLPSLIATSEEIANLSFKNSNINGKIDVTKVLDVSYVERGDYKLDIAELAKKDGAFSALHVERKKIKADVVVLVVHDDNALNCGLAAEINAKSDQAYVVVNWQCMTDRYSFIHEIAHLAGAWHDPKSVGKDYTISPAYAAGYITQGPRPVATIMAYIASCEGKCGRGMYWANPFMKTGDGQTLGTKNKNFDACVWRTRFPVMAKFGDQI